MIRQTVALQTFAVSNDGLKAASGRIPKCYKQLKDWLNAVPPLDPEYSFRFNLVKDESNRFFGEPKSVLTHLHCSSFLGTKNNSTNSLTLYFSD